MRLAEPSVVAAWPSLKGRGDRLSGSNRCSHDLGKGRDFAVSELAVPRSKGRVLAGSLRAAFQHWTNERAASLSWTSESARPAKRGHGGTPGGDRLRRAAR